MKTRNLLLGAMGLLLMASCAKDEVMDVNRDGDEIAFNVVANASTRVQTGENGDGGVYCNNNLPRTFYVWATTADDNKTFIEGDKVQYQNRIVTVQSDKQPKMLSQRGSIWTNTCLRYWPEDKNLNFYAAVNALKDDANYTFNWNAAESFNAPTIDVTVPTDVAQQKDLLYAVKKAQNKDTNKGIVSLNFRHALSQILFTAQTPSKNLYVKIEGVSICNAMSQNTFTYPNENTENNLNGHPVPDVPTVPNTNTFGTWGSASTPVNYAIDVNPAVEFNKTAAPDAEENAVVSLSGPLHSYEIPGAMLAGGSTVTTEYNTNAMLLLPQTSSPWNAKSDPFVKPAEQNGTYFLVKCLIFNIAGEEYNPATDICVWGNKVEGEPGSTPTYTAKEVAIPVKLNWQQGKKYIYNFVFGVLGGYDPEDNDGDPDLVPIDFTITVDEFAAVNTDIAQEIVQIIQ